MKKFYLFSLFIIGFGCLLSNCTRDNPVDTLGGNVSVELYKCSSGAAKPVLCFDSLIEDSRCPEGAVCFWEGRAVVKVRFISEGEEHQFNMAIPDFRNADFPNDTTINGYQIIFKDLIPRPTVKNTNNNHTKRAIFFIRKQ